MVSDGLELPGPTDDEAGEDKPKFVATSTQYTNQDGLVVVDRECVLGEWPEGTPRFVAIMPVLQEVVPHVGGAQFPMPGHPPIIIKLDAFELEAAVREAEGEYKRMEAEIRPKLKQAIFTGKVQQANQMPMPEGFPKFDPGANGQPPLRF